MLVPEVVTGALTEMAEPRSDAETEPPPILVTVEGNPPEGVTVKVTLAAAPLDSDGRENVRVGEVPAVMVDGTTRSGLEKTGRATTLRVPVADEDTAAALATVKLYVNVLLSGEDVAGALTEMLVPRSTAVIAPPPDLVTDPPPSTERVTLAADARLLVRDGSARDRGDEFPPVIIDGEMTNDAAPRTGTGTMLSVPDAAASVPAALETVNW